MGLVSSLLSKDAVTICVINITYMFYQVKALVSSVNEDVIVWRYENCSRKTIWQGIRKLFTFTGSTLTV